MHIKKFPSVVAVFAASIAVFSAAEPARAEETNNLMISEVLIGGSSASEEFIELYNPTLGDIDLALLPLKLHTINSTGTVDSSRTLTYTSSNSIIKSHDYFLLASTVYKDTHKEIAVGITYSASLVSDGTVYISTSKDSDLNVIDLVCWGTSEKCITHPANPKQNYSLERLNDIPEWQESCMIGGTPGKGPEECEVNAIPPDEKVYPAGIVLNEMRPDPSGKDDTEEATEEEGEFIELYNKNDFEVNLENWFIINRTNNSFSFSGKEWKIGPKGFLAIYYKDTGLTLHNTNGEKITLKDPNGIPVSEISFSGKAGSGQSYAKDGSEFFWTIKSTPGRRNIIISPEHPEEDEAGENFSVAENIFLNEILPNPKKDSNGEYIEIANGNSEPVDLFGWRLKDASKSKGYQFKEHTVLDPGGYLAIYKPDSKISLNNSNESVYLLNPKGETASSVTFEKSQKNASYNFDGESWRWSKYLTPGEKNKFDSAPSVKISKPKNVYKDIPTEFSVKAKDKETKKLKYAWDFGDGKKSSLAKTSHKYLDTDKYTVTLAVADDSQTVKKSFTISVKKSPRPDLEVVKLLPNPAGADTDGEYIDIKNSSGKKVDLKGWKIATGSGEKMYNHPINEEFVLNPGETKVVTREFSKFSLGNQTGKVRLVMPDGKIVDGVEYSKEKIAEGEVYAKINGGWQWISPDTEESGENAEEANEVIDDPTGEIESTENSDGENDGEILGATDENEIATEYQRPNFSSEDAFIFLSDIGFLKSQNKEIDYCPLNSKTASLEYFLISSI